MTADSARLALAISERLLDADAIANGISSDARGTLAGLAGTALVHARMSAVEGQFATAAIEHWNRAAACARRSGTGSGTFSGTGSIAASLVLGAPYLPDPQRLHEQCAAAARWLSAHALAIADQHHERLQSGERPASWAVYDVICGLTGLARVLVAAAAQGHKHVHAGLDAALCTLTAMINHRSGSRPGWWIPAEAHPSVTPIDPSGAAATGMAHGIAGPLAALTAACAAGHVVLGQHDAIRAAADWLLRWRDPATDSWAPHITGYELDHGTADPVCGRRDAWCYGTPGIAAAFAQASRALDDDKYQAAAWHAMRTLAERRTDAWDVEGPTLCHGFAGVLQAAARHPDLAEQAAARIVTAADPAHRYLIQHLERGNTHDDPGLLTGAAGVALALADHAELPSTVAPACHWDSILLLS